MRRIIPGTSNLGNESLGVSGSAVKFFGYSAPSLTRQLVWLSSKLLLLSISKSGTPGD